MCVVYNIFYQILSKQSATRMKYFAMLQSPGHRLNAKASGLFRLLYLGRHANNVDSLTMKNNLYVVIAAGELITLFWVRTRFNQLDWLNCFSSFYAACVKENLHSESESGLELTTRAPHDWQGAWSTEQQKVSRTW